LSKSFETRNLVLFLKKNNFKNMSKTNKMYLEDKNLNKMCLENKNKNKTDIYGEYNKLRKNIRLINLMFLKIQVKLIQNHEKELELLKKEALVSADRFVNEYGEFKPCFGDPSS
jgi:hypothetical protein